MSRVDNIRFSNMQVYYGVGKITKLRKKRTIEVWYENEPSEARQLKILNGSIHVVYSRKQTKTELTDAPFENRTFTAYIHFIDDKKYKGDVNLALEQEWLSELNHVSETEFTKIKTAILSKYAEVHGAESVKMLQLRLFL